jgi:hypothetical protein
MRKNWQEVPRDPIADDDVLEYLYDRSKVQGPTAVDKKEDSLAETENVQGRKKQPGSVHKSWSLKKLFS